MKKVITEPIRSENKIQLTGQVKSIRYEEKDILGHRLAHVELVTRTTFQKLSGRIVTQNTTHKVLMWQRHLENDINQIREGNILKIIGEAQTQPMQYGSIWLSTIQVFAYQFEILAEQGTLAAQVTKAVIQNNE